jgi:hypothetical protein
VNHWGILRSPSTRASQRTVFVILFFIILFSAGCRRKAGGTGEYVYVAVPQANLRDRVAAVYNKVGTVKSGDRLEILDRQKRFLRVRTAQKEEGWLEQRFIITEDAFKSFQKLDTDSNAQPSQGRGVTRAQLNMHITPSRDADTLYQLAEGEKVDVLKRATAERPQKNAPVATAKSKGKEAKPEEPVKSYDDYWLVKSQAGHYGWVLARMVDLDVPVEVAQYAEGQRIQGAYVLNQVDEDGKQIPQYLVVLSEPKDGMPYDYNQARVFTRNTRKHRYETAYRERNFMGFFPVKVGTESFDKEGVLPIFVLRVQAENGQVIERKYKLNSTTVRRVAGPSDEPKITTIKKEEKSGKPKARRR